MKRKIRLNNLVNDILNSCGTTASDCWINSSKMTRINGVPVAFSRIIYEEFIGLLPYKSRIHRTCKNGDCLNPNHMIPSSPQDKFWGLVIIEDENDCWDWVGAKDGEGYGMFSSPQFVEKKSHRIVWELKFGQIPDGLWVLHHCDNPSCVNPKHLFLGTHQDNMNDKVKKERQSRLFGTKCGTSKMDEFKVKEMRNIRKTKKYSYRKLSKLFGVSKAQARRIVIRESWSWVD